MLWSEITPDVMPAVQERFDLPHDTVGIEYIPLPFFKNGGLLKMMLACGKKYYAGVAVGGGSVEETTKVIHLDGSGVELHMARIAARIHLPTPHEALA